MTWLPVLPVEVPERREPLVASLLLGAGVAVVVLVAALLLSGGAPRTAVAGLPTADALTRWLVPVAELATRLAAVVTVGALLALPYTDGACAVRTARAAAAVWLAAALLAGLLAAADLAGGSVGPLLAEGRAGELLGSAAPDAGATAALVLVLLVAVGRVPPPAALVLALLALVPGVVSGHAADGPARALLLVHVAAALLWVGGLGALLLLASGPDLQRALRPYSRLALGCVVALAVTGVLQAALQLPGWRGLWGDGYGRLVLAKAAALLALAALGARHRSRTVPAAEQGRPAAFRSLAGGELLVMVGAVAIAVALARTPV